MRLAAMKTSGVTSRTVASSNDAHGEHEERRRAPKVVCQNGRRGDQ
jgi:hypothetical protein